MNKVKVLMAAAWSSLAAFSVLPAGTAHALSFSILGYECPNVSCVDLAAGGYDVSGGALVDPAVTKPNVYLTPGTDIKGPDLVNDSANVGSYNVTSKLDDPAGAASPIVVSNLPGLLSILWGSVDSYNLIEFFDGDTLVGSVTGSDIAALAGLSGQANAAGNFGFDANVSFQGTFDAVKLSFIPGVGTGVAFEVATAVPEPGTYALMGAGLAMLGFAARRRRAV
jgi:hypothetical protein